MSSKQISLTRDETSKESPPRNFKFYIFIEKEFKKPLLPKMMDNSIDKFEVSEYIL